jgi:TP901 family phage tail tape measure protein
LEVDVNRVISVILRGDISGLTSSMRAAGASVRETADRMTGASREAAAFRSNLSSVGDTAGKMGLAAVAGLGAIIVTTAKFDKAMSAVQAATHESASAMEDLREAAIDAGAQTAFSASEAAQGIEELAKAGVSTESILNGGLNGALDLAAAGALEVGAAAEIAATAMTQFSLDGSEVPHVADLLAAGAGKAQGSVQDMGAALGQSGLVAAQTGLTIEETTGTLASFASAGLLGSDSGTSFKTMLQALTPTSQKAAEEMERLGISAYDSQGNFVGMTTFADSLKNGLKDLSVEQQNAAMKTIFGADAVRAASVVFAQGGDGIQQWIDKVDDSGYASLTAATRLDNFSGDLEAFKGSLETALIGAGEGSTGPLRDLTQSATNAVNAFNALPGPLKGTASAMLGITAVLGGGLWFTAKTLNGIAAMRTNLAALGVTSATAGTAMTVLARAGAGLGAFWAGAALGDKVGQRSSKSVDELADSLDRFAKTGKATGDLKDLFGEDLRGRAVRFGKDLGGIGEALKSLEGYKDDGSMTEAIKFFGSAGQSAGITAQAEALGDLDSALSKMAKDSPDEAIAAFEKLRDRAMETGAEADDVARAFPEMAETLRSASEAMGGSSDTSQALAGDLSALGPAAAEASANMQATTEAMEKSRAAANDTALSFFNFARDAKQSFGDYLNELEKSADAFANFSQNVIAAGANGLDGGLIDQLKEQGPAGALALADFADASEKEIARANKAFRSTDGLVALQAELDQLPETVITEFETAGAPGAVQTALNVAAKYNMTPELVETILEAKDYTKADIKAVLARLKEVQAQHPEIPIGADIRGAMSDITYLQRMINGMNGKTVKVNVQGGTPGGITRATGGPVIGAGTGTSDSIPALLSNGEHVLTAAEVQRAGGQGGVYRLRAALRAGNLPAFATGGAVGSRYDDFSALTQSSKLDLAQQQKRIKDIEQSLTEKETIGKGKNKRRRLVLRGLDRTVAELELREAKADLARMKNENKKLKGYGTKEQEAARRDADEAAVKAAEDVVKEAADRFTSAKTSATSKFGIGSASSAAAVDRNLGRLLADSQTFLGLLGDLKAKGASPWLLAQLVEAGPTKGAIRLAKEYNTNQAALDSINGRAAQIDQFGNAYAGLVGNAAFSQAGAWNSGVSSASQAPAGAQVQIDVHPAAQLSEATIAHQVAGQLMWRMN